MVRSYHVALVAIALGSASAAPARDRYAVAKLVDVTDECSDMGGTHATFRLDEPAQHAIHAGGHGSYVKPTGTYYVLDITYKPSYIHNPGWCLDRMPYYIGNATRYMVASDLADARAKLADVRAHGWPAKWDSGVSTSYP
jgi:hypothetical protein